MRAGRTCISVARYWASRSLRQPTAAMTNTCDAFAVVGTTRPEKIGIFHASSLKVVQISLNASQCTEDA